jgi:hypothetical protein
MPRKKKPAVSQPVPQPSPAEEQQIEAPPVEGRVIKRPDGYYWQAKGRDAQGPFETRAEAEADLLAGGAEQGDFESADGDGTLHEAESELGISDWIDPDTGGPAEDNVPHIEDH